MPREELGALTRKRSATLSAELCGLRTRRSTMPRGELGAMTRRRSATLAGDPCAFTTWDANTFESEL